MVFDSNRNDKNENTNISYYKVSIITENRNQVFSRVWYSTRAFKWHFCISFRSCQLKCWRNYLLVFGLSNLFGGYIASVNYVAGSKPEHTMKESRAMKCPRQSDHQSCSFSASIPPYRSFLLPYQGWQMRWWISTPCAIRDGRMGNMKMSSQSRVGKRNWKIQNSLL